ncbi:hypothetical protein Pmar_PMAR006168 [Perkinsus marinus ATCC 50983]|uniref:Myb-like domain-containing protein n=1 Tax=Perkinsus marinus (strain ATCC 50983 / TXsc) TaxID=423536 RepID=C5LAE1_PERM5|nr:hypothetical protein Pmar_PMAR006168 [Perkinsus marinus ATCC 50983]EER06397.1 hypothetical protein Pmar_PMAR006168 [Perkinsus marinus ATCC 50983]|eukprot:XP_002774581.1 hypothetical protein Pmar_PMAR006168 [Perkinsus marinus ATCC 50983]
MSESPTALDQAWDSLILVATLYVDNPHSFLLEIYKTFADHLKDGCWSSRQNRVFEYISQGFTVMHDRYDTGGDRRQRTQIVEDLLYDLALVNTGMREKEQAKRRRKRAVARAEQGQETSQASDAYRDIHRRHPLLHGPSTGRKVSASFDSDDDDEEEAAGEGEGTEETDDSDDQRHHSRLTSPAPRESNHEAARFREPETAALGAPGRDHGPCDERGTASREADATPGELRNMPDWMPTPQHQIKWTEEEQESLERGMKKYAGYRKRWQLMLADPELKFAPHRTKEQLRDRHRREEKRKELHSE